MIPRPLDLSFSRAVLSTNHDVYTCFSFSIILGWIYVFIPFLLSSVCLSTHNLLLSRNIHSESYDSNFIPRQRLIGKIAQALNIVYESEGQLTFMNQNSSDHNEIIKEMTFCTLN